MSTHRHLLSLVLITTACGVTPVSPPRIEHDAAVDFGAVAASNFATRAFTLRNPGDEPVTVTLSLDEGPFSVTKTSVAVDRRASATVEIRFAPAALGPVTRVLHVETDDATSDVTLTGSGTGPRASAPATLSFGQVPLVAGHPDLAGATLTVRNTGTSGTVLHLALPTVDGDEVCVGEWSGDTCTPWTPASLDVGASVNIPLSLKPHATGAREWHLSFLSDDPLTLRHEVTLRAVVEAASPCDLELRPSPLLVRRGSFINGLCITDALEQTPDAGGAWNDITAFARDAGTGAMWSTVTGQVSSPCAIEAADDGVHRALVDASNGAREDICTPDWWHVLSSLGRTDCVRRSTVWLSQRPFPVTSIELWLDGALLPAVDAQGQLVWAYDGTHNGVHFQPGHELPDGSTLEIHYQATCVP